MLAYQSNRCYLYLRFQQFVARRLLSSIIIMMWDTLVRPVYLEILESFNYIIYDSVCLAGFFGVYEMRLPYNKL